MVLLCESVNTKSNTYVHYGNSQGTNDQRSISPYVKLGRINPEAIRGWLRHGMEKLLLGLGISVCHPLADNSIVSKRNKELYPRDLELGYHPRDSCKDDSFCVVARLFGGLDRPGNLCTPAAYYYPASNASMFSNLNKAFGSIGTGYQQVSYGNARVRHNSTEAYIITETITGCMIEVPYNFMLREANDMQRAVLLKSLEYLQEKNQAGEFAFMIGGKRNLNVGRMMVVFVNDKGKYLTQDRNCIGLPEEEASKIDEIFAKFVEAERERFPISYANNNNDNKKGKARKKNGK
jgi:hypothetical protein